MSPGEGSGSGRVTLLGVESSSRVATITMSLPPGPNASTDLVAILVVVLNDLKKHQLKCEFLFINLERCVRELCSYNRPKLMLAM